ncbi:MAG: AAA family ATPase [Candidatus Lokiarchaeota archaeon]|nr:AAA family ATPase [Candidatus Lokiarchaeota archaeon]MBD3337519.1 AAA family ATPase [Candidatus Lokiarchaeota archaeon]
MVIFLSKPTHISTRGEKSFYYRLKDFFEEWDGVFVYFEPNIQGLRPDCLILSPIFGVIVVEIKDYIAHKLREVSKSGNWSYLNDSKVTTVKNPFDQMYQYWRAIKNITNYCHFPDNVHIPIIRLIGFSQISDNEDGAISKNIQFIAPKKLFLCFKEHFNRNKNFKNFFSGLNLQGEKLSDKHFKILRANLIPTCRLPTVKQSNLRDYYTPEDRIKLLDSKQEALASKLGKGHRLVFGVAGSGKTVLVIARTRYLALRNPDWKILVLCYNRLLKNLLFHMLNPQDFEADITISTFHSWLRNYILSAGNEFSRLYMEAEELAKSENKISELFRSVAPKLMMEFLNDLGNSKIKYDAILIDEGQDFESDWFKIIMEVINLKTNSLLITCDGIQGIYARKQFSWSSVGIEARGRTRRFEKSYRTPIEIGFLAQEALPENLRKLLDKSDEFISTKKFIGKHGTVEIIISDTRREEYLKLARKVSSLLKTPQQILVLFKYNMSKKNYNHYFFKLLEKMNIKWKDLETHNFESPKLLIGTLHGTKGLECDTIIIPEVDLYDSDDDRQLLYVGITRSRKNLIISASKSTELVQSLKNFQTL